MAAKAQATREGESNSMTFKELERYVNRQEAQQEPNNRAKELLKQKIRNKPFWIYYRHPSDMVNCCFNHIISLPKKNGVEHPIYDYEVQIVRALEQPSYLNSRQPTKQDVRNMSRD